MMAVWSDLGISALPLLVSGLAVLALSVWTGSRLFGGANATDLRTKAWVDAVLFWGGFAMVTGLLGSLVGFMQAAQMIETAGSVSPALLWGGMKVATSSAAVGLVVLVLASMCWFVLQLRWRLLTADAAPSAA